jgi:predicted ester cyclase
MSTDTILPLVRRWAVDWLGSHDPIACDDLLVPDYVLRIGTHEFTDRESYVAATVGQLALFPGLVLTVHEVITDGNRAALRFTEHGASTRHAGRAAAWTGIVMFESDGTRLVRTWAEEDYHARRRQLASGESDAVGAPAVAPWDSVAYPPCEPAERVVVSWVEAGMPGKDGVVRDDEHLVPSYEPVFKGESGKVDMLLSVGTRVAFHATVRGRAVNGSDRFGEVGVAGLVTVTEGAIVCGNVVTDRLGAIRSFAGEVDR